MKRTIQLQRPLELMQLELEELEDELTRLDRAIVGIEGVIEIVSPEIYRFVSLLCLLDC